MTDLSYEKKEIELAENALKESANALSKKINQYKQNSDQLILELSSYASKRRRHLDKFKSEIVIK